MPGFSGVSTIFLKGVIMLLHKVNKEQRLFVMKCGDGFTCYGFDVLDRKGRALSAELGVTWKQRKGTIKAFTAYNYLLNVARAENKATGKRFTYELTKQLIGLEGCRVEVTTTYNEVRRFYVGKSTGWCPCHLEIARCDSTGGGAAEHEYNRVTVIKRG